MRKPSSRKGNGVEFAICSSYLAYYSPQPQGPDASRVSQREVSHGKPKLAVKVEMSAAPSGRFSFAFRVSMAAAGKSRVHGAASDDAEAKVLTVTAEMVREPRSNGLKFVASRAAG